MSLQQVNLYQDELKTQKLNYSALMLAQLSLISFWCEVFSITAASNFIS